MKKALVEILACPGCRGPLEVSAFKEEQFAEKETMEGLLVCENCGISYPVVEGIPRFVPNAWEQNPEFLQKYPDARNHVPREQFEKLHGSTQERFSFEWMRYPGSLEEDREIFLTETQTSPEEWENQRVLDGGCGMGRYSRVAHELGAAVVAMDIGTALVRLLDLARSSPGMHVVQGDLTAPPFKKEVFDIVYSVGVIHHTPSARKTFGQLAPLVKKGGKLSVWVYGAPGRFPDFKTNPLREDRRGLKRFLFPVWLTVWVREKISDGLRLFTVHMPHRLLYGMCHGLALAGAVPFLKYLTFSVHPLWRVRLQENFDWLTPPYQSHHTKEELMSWFGENGFRVLKVLPHGFVPKPGVLGKKS